MNNFKSLLKDNSISWLLENDNPSVKYYTLRDILEKPGEDLQLRKVRQEIAEIGPVPAIMAKQKEEGYWETPERFYSAHYKGTVWQLLILAELGADITDAKIKKACDFILNISQDLQSGGFAYSAANAKKDDERHNEVVPCLTGNMVWSLIRLGYLDDPRIKLAIKWITDYQRFDDGIQEPPEGWPYDELKTHCFEKHTCHMGVVKTLKALSEIPENKRSVDVKNMIEKGAQYILKHHIYKKSHNLNKVAKPDWLKFGFPLMYHTDALEILGILTQLGYKDKRMQDAVDILISKQNEQGRWKLENTFNGRFHIDIEQKDKPSKWITLNALRVLKRFYV